MRRTSIVILACCSVLLAATSAVAAPPSQSGDHNGDGFADLAVGVPYDEVGGVSNAGSVNVIYGSAAGLSATTVADELVDLSYCDQDAEANDHFGQAVATGDFNGDGFADLAVGFPSRDVVDGPDTFVDAGAVCVVYGSPAGLDPVGAQLFHQGSVPVSEDLEEDDRFGSALAAGDFDNDGFDELAIGIPGEDHNIGSVEEDAGLVQVLSGSAVGLGAPTQTWNQDTGTVIGSWDTGDQFGAALAVGNFGKSVHEDLAIGVPGEDVAAFVVGAGAVNVLYGSAGGLDDAGNQYWHQDSPGVQNAAGSYDSFGSSLAAANLGNGSQADLAIGVPNEDISGHSSAGAVHVLYGGGGGLSTTGAQFWSQSSAGVGEVPAERDYFGRSLAGGNLGKGSVSDLAIGVDGEDIGTNTDAGAVHVLYGTANGLSSAGSQVWHQNSPGVIGVSEPDDEMGHAVRIGNFGTGVSDLAVGVPSESIGANSYAGIVLVLYGTSGGLTGAGSQNWHQDIADVEGTQESHEHFGQAL